jgi:ribosomal protein S12 methylthiotransferase accessory factor
MVIESDYRNIDDFEKHVFLYAYGDMLHAVDFLLGSERSISLADVPSGATGDVRRDLRRVMRTIAERDYEMLVVDLTTCDVASCGFVVVKVLVPAMQPIEGDHTHRFLGGRRLAEVPLALGYGGAATLETFNPYPHPYP